MTDQSGRGTAWKKTESSELPQAKMDELLLDRDFDAQSLVRLLADLRSGRAGRSDSRPGTPPGVIAIGVPMSLK
jgi:hypothetical protein